MGLIKELRAKFLCCHDWELKKEVNIYANRKVKKPFEIRSTYVCRKCGKIKKINL